VFCFSLQLLSETFFILRRNERDMVKCTLVFIWSTLYWSSCEVPFIGLHVKYPLLVFMWSTLYWSSCEVPFIGLHVKYPLLVCMWSTLYSFRFQLNLKFLDRFLKNTQISDFKKMTKLIVAFRNIANAPENALSLCFSKSKLFGSRYIQTQNT
jgi:hypothetical protein